jgi:hypothetical protein
MRAAGAIVVGIAGRLAIAAAAAAVAAIVAVRTVAKAAAIRALALARRSAGSDTRAGLPASVYLSPR